MSPRDIYAALFDPRGPIREPSGDWVHLGQVAEFDSASFMLLAERIRSPTVYVAVTRSLASEVPMPEVIRTVIAYLQHGEVRLSNAQFSEFVQVNPMGVARRWSRESQA